MTEVKRDWNGIHKAIEFSTKAHRGQLRKNKGLPYIFHPLNVGRTLLEYGCFDTPVIAGILHDTLEDTNTTYGTIHDVFGEEVAGVVREVSEPDKSISWEERKLHTILAIENCTTAAALVMTADKMDNLSDITIDLVGCENMWKNFKRGPLQQAWYYYGMVSRLKSRLHGTGSLYEQMVAELVRKVEHVFPLKDLNTWSE